MTNKIKISSGLASIILLACIFSGWETLLIVTVLMLLFCETDKNVKDIAIKVISFCVALNLVSYGWDLISDGVNLIINSIDDIVDLINSYLNYGSQISIAKLQSYLLSPIAKLLNIANDVVAYLILFAKFSFIIAVLGNKQLKENIIVSKINNYITKVVNFINTFDYASQQSQQQSQQQSNQSNHNEQIFPNPNGNFNDNNNPNFYSR